MSRRSTQPWRRLRDLEPPLGSERRVMAAVEDAIDREAVARQPQRLVPALAVAAVVAVVALVWLAGRPGSGDRLLGAVDPSPVAGAGAADVVAESAGDPPAVEPRAVEPAQDRPPPDDAPPEIRVAAADSIAVDLPDAAVTVSGPAAVRVTRDALVVREGRVVVAGSAIVRAPACDARIRGRARVDVGADAVTVRVFAGSAEIASAGDAGTCTVTELVGPGDDRAEADEPAPAADADEQASLLRLQLEAVRRARALAGADDEAALAAWREIARRWPDSPFREEVAAAAVETLARLGHEERARRAAAAFLRRYPESAYAARMHAIAGGAP